MGSPASVLAQAAVVREAVQRGGALDLRAVRAAKDLIAARLCGKLVLYSVQADRLRGQLADAEGVLAEASAVLASAKQLGNSRRLAAAERRVERERERLHKLTDRFQQVELALEAISAEPAARALLERAMKEWV